MDDDSAHVGTWGTRMKVLVISAAFPPMRLGEATNALHLCQHLADRKLDVHVLTSHSNTAVDDRRIRIHPIMCHWSWSELPRFRRILKRCSPDAVLLMYIGLMYDYHPMITFAPSISKDLLPGIPFVTRFENAFASSDPSRTSLLARGFRKGFVLRWVGVDSVDYGYGTLLRDSDHIVVLCRRHLLALSEHFPGMTSKTILIPPPPNMLIVPEDNGKPRQRGREMLKVSPEEFLVAYLGYMYPNKGVETLLQAFRIVANQRRNARLVLIGGRIDPKITIEVKGWNDASCYFSQMQQLAKQLGIEGRTAWTGAYASDSVEPSLYLYATDACVLPFDQGVQLNNSSFSCAAAHGLPIVTTRGEILDQPFIHNENVLLCPPKNPTAVADAIISLIDNPELHSRLRRGARTLAKECFSWETAIDHTIAAFHVKS